MIVPLKPGILSSQPLKAQFDSSVVLEVECYNTHLDQTSEVQAFLKHGDAVIKANKIEITDATHANLFFDLPASQDNKQISPTLLIDNPIDGIAILPSALIITGNGNKNTLQKWAPLDIESLHQNENFLFPFRNVLHETIRNTFFHVAIWFAMFILFIVSLIHSIRYLRKGNHYHDRVALAFTQVGIVFGLVGLATGSVWAKYTWGAFWTSDIKLNMSAIAILIYLAYLILRASITDTDSRARLSAAYNIFSFCMLIPLIMIVPRLTDSLHPGNGGNPALGGEDMDNTLRMVFYPAVIGLTLLGVWLSSLSYRIHVLKEKWISE